MLAVLLSTLGAADVDWLLSAPDATASARHECWPEYATAASGTPCGIALSNGLTSRRFLMTRSKVPSKTPLFGTIDWILNASLEYGGTRSMFRAAEPEGIVRIDGVDYEVGGMRSIDSFRAYCNRSEFLTRSPAQATRARRLFTRRTASACLRTISMGPWHPRFTCGLAVAAEGCLAASGLCGSCRAPAAPHAALRALRRGAAAGQVA